MNWRAIRAVVRKDLKVVGQSKMVMLPLILVPLLMLVILPLGMTLPIVLSPEIAEASSDIDELVEMLPEGLGEEFAEMARAEVWVRFTLLYMYAPLFLIVPVMVASVIAADSFVGEKERKTIEAVLHSPITDEELLVAKMLSAWIPAMLVALISFVLYTIVANVAGWITLKQIIFPTLTWIILILWVTPAAAGLGLGAIVLVSTRVKTFQEAYQIGGMMVLPIVALVLGQSFGLIYFSPLLTLLLGLILWLIDGVIFWFGSKIFRRSELITRL
jgi:ABC-2 type transport system permease protein